jgi:hypothetical protein
MPENLPGIFCFPTFILRQAQDDNHELSRAGGITSNFKLLIMQELIDKLKAEAGLTDEQAKQAIATIKGFVVDKFPMLEGAVDSMFGEN